MNSAFIDYYRCPDLFANFHLSKTAPTKKSEDSGQQCCDINFSEDNPSSGSRRLVDLLEEAEFVDSACVLSFNPTEVADSLRYERYVKPVKKSGLKGLIREAYYLIRPILPVHVRRHLQRVWLRGWDQNPFPNWPVDRTVDQMFAKLMRLALMSSGVEQIPFIWFWPDRKSSGAMMTHDVETDAGLKFCDELMNINDLHEVKSSFQLIPDARYIVSENILSKIKLRGFEVNVHDLKHDGHLFDNYEHFREAATKINRFAVAFGSKGFRAGALYRNQEWFDALELSYEMSVPNVGHLDPQPGGCCTVMPYFVNKILVLPLTTTQDYSLFNLLETYSPDLWDDQIDKIMEQHGLISFIVHPDYLYRPEARNAYVTLLAKLSSLRSDKDLWIALPNEIDTWWRQRNSMKLVTIDGHWQIEGDGSERACLAYASIQNNELTYTFSENL